MHNDGRMIADAVKRLGVCSVAGSSSRGGKEALLQLKNLIREGNHIGITPDGPKGPCYSAKPGVVSLASSTGAPVCPVAYSASRYFQFGSWDKMILPKPFSKVVFVMGELLFIPASLSEEKFEEHRQRVEKALNEVMKQADEIAQR